MLQPFETIRESNLFTYGTDEFAELSGLSFVGMTELFKDPHFEGDCHLGADVEWHMQFTDREGENHVFTLYNVPGPALDRIREWYVGFNLDSSPEVRDEFYHALIRYLAKFTKTEVCLSLCQGPHRPVTIHPAEP